jgi:hypothetical protein
MYNAQFYEKLAKGNIQAFDNYSLTYYTATYTAIARLSGLTDTMIIAAITEEVFQYLWENRHLFVQSKPVGALLFRTTLSFTLQYLSKIDDLDRINQLRQAISCNEPFLILNNFYNG